MAIGVPAPAVLVDQPGSRVALGAGLGGGDLGGLQRGRDHHQPVALSGQQLLGGAQRGGLAGTSGAFDHDEPPVAGQGADDGGLGRVDPDQSAPADARPAGWLRRTSRDPGDYVGLDIEHLRRA